MSRPAPFIFWLLLTTLLPITSDALWWDLARGRGVMEGALSPARMLLAAESSAEADWLGGLPAYLAFSGLGASGLMVATLLLAAGVARLLLRRLPAASSPHVGLFLIFGTWTAARGAWGLSTETFDLLGVTAVWVLLERWQSRPGRPLVFCTALIFLVWANLGIRPVLGLSLLLSGFLPLLVRRGGIRGAGEQVNFGGEGVAPRRLLVSALILAVVAVCLTPRGVWSLWDSVRLTWPELVAPTSVLRAAGWASLPAAGWNPATVGFVLLSAWALVELVRTRANASASAGFLIVQATAWLDGRAMPLAAVWTALLIAQALRVRATVEAPAPSERSRRRLSAAGLLGCLGFGITAAAGVWPGSPQRIGWGLHPRLEPRLCEAAFEGMDLAGTAWTPDVRSAGLLAWLRPSRLQPYDVPQRALLEGRLAEHVLLWRDLAAQRRGWHRREDGSYGGWWLFLMEREIRILMVPAEETTVIRSMEPEIWKPLSLDSPVIPYGRAGDPATTNRIVAVLHQRELVDLGSWSYQPPHPRGDDLHLDLWGALTGRPSVSVGVRQARVFRKMNLHVAALRVLAPLQGVRMNAPAVLEFSRCQIELAHREHRLMGRASAFRRRVCLASPWPDEMPVPEWLHAEPAGVERLPDAVEAYRRGRPGDAALLLTEASPELLYAKGLLQLEAGDPAASAESFRRLLALYPESHLSIASQDVLDQFSF